MTHIEAITRLEALYALIPPMDCQRKCGEACGPIGLSHLERTRVQQASPGRTFIGKTLSCPMLANGTSCTVYAVRPMVCRLYGVLSSLACPFGCLPAWEVSEEDGANLMQAAEALSQAVFQGKKPYITHPQALLDLMVKHSR